MSATANPVSTDHDTPRLEAKFGSLLDAVPDPLLMIDTQGRIVLANELAGQLFGYSKRELLGHPAEMLLPPRFQVDQPFSESTSATSGLCGLRKNGSEFPIEIVRKSVQIEGGKWMLLTIRDLTEQLRIQKSLDEKNAALETARQEFHAFSHSISHDLRAPLRAIDGFSMMLKRSLGAQLSEETEHSLHRIHENVSRMSKLIEGLLDFSTLSWVALTIKKIQPGDVVQKSFAGLSLAESGRQVDFAIEELPDCEADAALLRRLFDNLLSNALKFTRKKELAKIRVGCRSEKGEQVYFVQDNGAGFDMEYSGKLFQVFQRLHSPSEFEGTGTGLAIVQRIVQRHGGKVWAEAQVEQGATFYFTLGNSGYEHSA